MTNIDTTTKIPTSYTYIKHINRDGIYDHRLVADEPNEIVFPEITTTLIMSRRGNSELERPIYCLYADVYENYAEIHEDVDTLITLMLDTRGREITLYEHFVAEMQQLGLIEIATQMYHRAVVIPCRVFDETLFRHVAMSCMIGVALAERGFGRIVDTLNKLGRSYRPYLDEHCGVGDTERRNHPCSLIHWPQYPPTHPLHGLPNYGRRPVVRIDLKTSVKDKGGIKILTTIYGPNGTPLTEYNALTPYLTEVGNKRRGEMRVSIEIRRPVVLIRGMADQSLQCSLCVDILRIHKSDMQPQLSPIVITAQENRPSTIIVSPKSVCNIDFFVTIVVMSMIYVGWDIATRLIR